MWNLKKYHWKYNLSNFTISDIFFSLFCKMSHHFDGGATDNPKNLRVGILPTDLLPTNRIPSHHQHHQHNQHLTIESFLQSRACCKLLLFWSVLTTLASMLSVFYAIDVHNSLVQKQDIRDAILSRDFVPEKQTGLDALLHRPKYISINLSNL